MNTEPTYDPSNVHTAQGQTSGSIQFLDPGHAEPGADGPYTAPPDRTPACTCADPDCPDPVHQELTGPTAACTEDAPVPCTLTPKADAYLAGLSAEVNPAVPEPGASL